MEEEVGEGDEEENEEEVGARKKRIELNQEPCGTRPNLRENASFFQQLIYLDAMRDLIESDVFDFGLPIDFEIEQGVPSVSESDDGGEHGLTIFGRGKGELQPRVNDHSITRSICIDERTEQQQKLQ